MTKKDLELCGSLTMVVVCLLLLFGAVLLKERRPYDPIAALLSLVDDDVVQTAP